MPYVFGVDGGGSSSRALMITDRGRVVYCGKGPGVNYHEVGASQAVRVIEKLYEEALGAARARRDECVGIGLGLAGAGRDKDREILEPLFKNAFGDTPLRITTDADVALTSGALSDSGVIVICGTGTMVHGRNEQQETARAGGYGPLISDEGGGYWLAIQALRRIAQAHDGCGIPTALTASVLEHLQLKDFDGLIHWIHSQDASRKRVAEIAPLVVRAASEDDPVADELLNQGADALAIGVEAVHKRLGFSDRFDVVLSGGLITHATLYAQLVRRKILYLLPGASVNLPRMEPVFGAAFFAYSLAGLGIDQDLLHMIQTTYREYQDRAAGQSITPASQHSESPKNKFSPEFEAAETVNKR